MTFARMSVQSVLPRGRVRGRVPQSVRKSESTPPIASNATLQPSAAANARPNAAAAWLSPSAP